MEAEQQPNEVGAEPKASTAANEVHLRPNDPFDLEAYIAPYIGTSSRVAPTRATSALQANITLIIHVCPHFPV